MGRWGRRQKKRRQEEETEATGSQNRERWVLAHLHHDREAKQEDGSALLGVDRRRRRLQIHHGRKLRRRILATDRLSHSGRSSDRECLMSAPRPGVPNGSVASENLRVSIDSKVFTRLRAG